MLWIRLQYKNCRWDLVRHKDPLKLTKPQTYESNNTCPWVGIHRSGSRHNCLIANLVPFSDKQHSGKKNSRLLVTQPLLKYKLSTKKLSMKSECFSSCHKFFNHTCLQKESVSPVTGQSLHLTLRSVIMKLIRQWENIINIYWPNDLFIRGWVG